MVLVPHEPRGVEVPLCGRRTVELQVFQRRDRGEQVTNFRGEPRVARGVLLVALDGGAVVARTVATKEVALRAYRVSGCRDYAAWARQRLAERLATERAAPGGR